MPPFLKIRLEARPSAPAERGGAQSFKVNVTTNKD